MVGGCNGLTGCVVEIDQEFESLIQVLMKNSLSEELRRISVKLLTLNLIKALPTLLTYLNIVDLYYIIVRDSQYRSLNNHQNTFLVICGK